MKYLITIIGHYSTSLDGQTIKTKIITDELINRYGRDRVNIFNTVGGLKAFFRAFFAIPSFLKNSKNVCMLPAHNALRVLTPLISFWNRRYKRTLHYCVIGGWLPDFIKNRKLLADELRRFDYIYVETASMKTLLEEQGLGNVVVMPNCKKLKILKPEELVYHEAEPHKLCTFSRVSKEKGIMDAIAAVKTLNKENERYVLDIYGQIDKRQQNWFSTIEHEFPPYIRYKGVVPFEKTTEVLKDYHCLLFPTYYVGEGFPGTLIDAFAAGLPIIASDWRYNSEIVEDGKTGYIFETNNIEMLSQKIEYLMIDKDRIKTIKYNCIEKAKDYLPENAVEILFSRLD